MAKQKYVYYVTNDSEPNLDMSFDSEELAIRYAKLNGYSAVCRFTLGDLDLKYRYNVDLGCLEEMEDSFGLDDDEDEGNGVVYDDSYL